MGKIFKAIGSIFKPKMPKLPKPVSMPDPGSIGAKVAARNKIEKRRREGREGTIMTGGGTAYSGQNLGGTS